MAYYCITGANSGLGLKTVMTLLSEPEDAVVFGLDINTAAMESNPSLAAHLKQRKLFPIRTDVTSSASVAAATAVIARLLEEHGQGLDGVAHFAGVNEGGPLVEMKDEDFTRVINVNVTGVWRVEKALFPFLRARGGRTVLVSSEVALSRATTAFSAPYPISKIAVEGLATAMRQEFACLPPLSAGNTVLPPMKVIVINPGACSTPMLPDTLRTNFDKHIDRGSLWSSSLAKGRTLAEAYMAKNAGSPQRVADAVCVALKTPSPQARYIVNRSWEMWALQYTPQWILDFAIRMQLA